MQSADSFIQQGRSFVQQQRYAEAVQAFGQAAQIEPDNKDSLTELGLLCRELGDTSGAIGFFERVAELDENDAFVRLQLGLVQYETGQLDDALTTLEHSVALIDGGVEAARGLMSEQTFADPVGLEKELVALEQTSAQTRQLIEAIATERAAEASTESDETSA